MTGAAAAVAHYLGEFAAHRGAFPGGDQPWVQQIREEALERFESLGGFPGPRLEDWKYTRVAPIEKHPFRTAHELPTAPTVVDEIKRATVAGQPQTWPHCAHLVFVDGLLCKSASSVERQAKGLEISSMSEALARSPETLQMHLGHYADPRECAFPALNTAFMSEGAFIHLSRETVLDAPILLTFLSTGRESEAAVISHPRVLIVLDAASRACVVETYATLDPSALYFNNPVTEVVLKAGAHLDHCKIQLESASAFHVATIQTHQARESQFSSHAISLGGRLVRHDINSRLEAEGAVCHLNGLYIAGARQHMDFHTRVDHVAPRCTSVEVYKGILSGRSRGVFNGRVYVHPRAQKTDAQQSNDNLLLSEHAEIDTKPQLEIYANDVKCAHGATVGQLDDDMIFYLQSRGLDESTAKAMLTYGFAEDIIEGIPVAALREQLTGELLGRMPGADQLRGIMQ